MGSILFLVILLSTPADAALTQVGAAAAVAGGVTATATETGSKSRTLSSGKSVFYKDKIATDARGRLQVLLLDETVFTLGPDTEMELDEFVYDPFDEAGTVSTRVNKGTFRFVSGKVARKRPSSMKVLLPTGTMGIRGTIAGGTILPDGSILIALLGPGADNNAGERPGSITVTNAGQTVTLTQPGFATIIRPGQPPAPPFQMTPKQLAQLNTKPAAEPGSGEPEGVSQDAKSTGELGEATTIAKATGSSQAESEDDTQSTTNAATDIDVISDGQATWDDVRTIPSGQAHYQYSGAAFQLTSCNGSACNGDGTAGSLSFQMNIDFGAQTFGGLGSSISIFDTDTAGGGVTASDSATINLTSFAALPGNATIALSGSNTSFQINIQNSGGNPATSANVAAVYSNASTTGAGSANAAKFDGLIPQ